MVPGAIKVLSDAELDVWCHRDADETDAPSDAECGYALDTSTEDGHSDDAETGADGVMRRFSSGSLYSVASTPRSQRPASPTARPQPLLPLGDGSDDEQLGATVGSLRQRGPGLKAIFLDYDGTLREFESTPDEAVPTAELHDLLSALNRREDLLVHIISGRQARFLSGHFARYDRMILIAEHERRVAGRFQIWRSDADGEGVGAEPMQDWRTCVRFEMSRMCKRCPGSQVEVKSSSVVWHFRAVEDEGAADTAASSLARRLGELVAAQRLRGAKVSRHNKTVEVSRRTFSKGDMVRRICESHATVDRPFEAVLVAGDDVSDEPMFDVEGGDSFLSVKVGEGGTTAKYFVDSPAKLREFLWQIAA